MTSDLAPWFVLLTALIVVGGFFSASETALFSSNRLTLRRLSDEGDRRARVAHRLLQDPGELLTTLLVGNTIADIGASVLATSMAIRIIGRGHGEWAAFVTVTLIVLIFSEIAPKTLAARRADRMALWVAEPIQAVGRVLGPLIRVLSVVATTLIRPFGAPITTRPPLVTEEQLRFLVEVGEEEGVIEEEEREMIHSIFEMGETLVREVMRPRIDIIGLPSSATIDEALGLMIEFGHTRLPVYEGSVDHIIGVVYVRDVLPGVREGRRDTPCSRCCARRFSRRRRRRSTNSSEMQRKKVSMAIVLDEYGGTEGLVTMEDILEEIVGEIQDEHDLEEADRDRRRSHGHRQRADPHSRGQRRARSHCPPLGPRRHPRRTDLSAPGTRAAAGRNDNRQRRRAAGGAYDRPADREGPRLAPRAGHPTRDLLTGRTAGQRMRCRSPNSCQRYPPSSAAR